MYNTYPRISTQEVSMSAKNGVSHCVINAEQSRAVTGIALTTVLCNQ